MLLSDILIYTTLIFIVVRIIVSYVEETQKKIKDIQNQITSDSLNVNTIIQTLENQINQLQTDIESNQQNDQIELLQNEIQDLKDQISDNESNNNQIIQTIQNEIEQLQTEIGSMDQTTEPRLLEKNTDFDDLSNKTYTLSNNSVVTAFDFVYTGTRPAPPTYSNNVLSYTKPSTTNTKFIYYLYQNESFQFGSQNITEIPESLNITGFKMRDLYRWLVEYRLYDSNNPMNPTNAIVFIQIYTKPKNDGLDFQSWYRSRYFLKDNLNTQNTTNQQKYLNIELNNSNYNPISNINLRDRSLSKLTTFEEGLDDDILALSIQSSSGETNEFTFDLLYSNLIYKN